MDMTFDQPPVPAVHEVPYVGISGLLRKGRVVPFLGAGVNTRAPERPWFHPGAPFLPRGAELSRHLAGQIPFPSLEGGEDLAKVAAYGEEVLGRPWLRDSLREVFDDDFEPCEVHTHLASVPRELLIVTTNYDDLTERAFRRAGRSFHVVVHPFDRPEWHGAVLWWKPDASVPEMVEPNNLRLIPGQQTIIYKMHGTVYRGSGRAEPEPPADDRYGYENEWDNYLITEDDYVEFLSRMTTQPVIPSTFVQHFARSQFLFMGYGLNDWNLRVVLRNLAKMIPTGPEGSVTAARLSRGPSWAIQHKPSLLEQKLWSTRGVNIYNMELGEFVHEMSRVVPPATVGGGQ